MRRPFVTLMLLTALLAPAGVATLTAPATAAPPAPSPSSLPQGVSVIPAPGSPHRSKSGSFLELGTVDFGRPVTDAVVLRSTFDHAQDVYLYAADAQPAVGGGFGFGARADKPAEVGSWLRLSVTSVRLPAGGQLRVPLAVTVPPGVSGGEYVGAVIAEPLQQGPATAFQTRFRFAMAVYLRVPGGTVGATPGRGVPGGRLHVLAVTPGVHGNLACPVVRYRNDSQDIVDPKVTVRTEGLLGGSYSRSRTGALLPGSSAAVPLPCLKRPLGPGRLVVALRSPQGDGRVAVDFSWWPTALVAALGLLLLLLAALVSTAVRGLRRRERAPDSTVRETS
ncbi:MAG: hypothetical protein NVSMB55_08660 [Mycobacteriales bacterium]